jgi:hypothetical protein
VTVKLPARPDRAVPTAARQVPQSNDPVRAFTES